MKTSIKSICQLVTMLLLTACDSLVQDVSPDRLPKSDIKLVVHSYLSPQDTILAVKVELSKSLFGTTQTKIVNGNFSINDAVVDATVTLADGTKMVNLKFNPNGFGEYIISAKSMSIVAGKTYTLKVTTPSGLSAESSCTIPERVAIKEVKLDSVASRYNTSQYDKTVRVIWQDPIGKGNFYRVQGGVNIQYIQPAQGTQPAVIYQNWNQIYFGDRGSTSELQNDEANDGVLMASPQGRIGTGFYGNNTKILKTAVYLISADRNYYNYHKSFTNSDDNPFSEPSLTPSNIKGGFGCFAGFNTTQFVLK